MSQTITLEEVNKHLVGTERPIKQKYQDKMIDFLRVNNQYDGACFTYDDKTSRPIVTAYILAGELLNPRFIPEPQKVVYFDRLSGKYYIFSNEYIEMMYKKNQSKKN